MASKLSSSVLKKIGSVGKALNKNDRREAVQMCVAYIKAHPEEADMIWLVLQGGVLPQLAQSTLREPIPSCVTHLSVLSLKPAKSALVLLRQDLDKGALKKIHAHDAQQVRHCLYFAAGATPDTAVAQGYVDEFMAWVTEQSNALGGRIKNLKFTADGQALFSEFGEYALVGPEDCTDADPMTMLKRNSSGVTVELDPNFTFTKEAWAIKHNSSKADAVLSAAKSSTQAPIFDLFHKKFPENFPAKHKRASQQKAAETRASKRKAGLLGLAAAAASEAKAAKVAEGAGAESSSGVACETPTPRRRIVMSPLAPPANAD